MERPEDNLTQTDTKEKEALFINMTRRKIKNIVIIILLIAVLAAAVITIFKVTDKTIANVNNNRISDNMYYYSLLIAKENILKNHTDMKESDVWSYKQSETADNYGDQVEKYVLQNLVRTALINNQFHKLNLKFTDSQIQLCKKNIAARIEEYGGMDKAKKIFQKYHITYDDFASLYEDYDRFESVFLYYFGVNGVYPVSNNEVDQYYAKNNARVKSILIPLTDDSGKSLSDEDKAKARELAIEAENLAESSKDTDNFDDLISKYNKDTGVKSYPDGYIITQDYTAIPEYKTTAFSLKTGEVKMIETSQGFYILKKYDSLDSKVYTAYQRRQALFDMKNDDFENLINKWKDESKITYNKTLIEKHDIQDISVS
jgi:parvulin-like peptidyl-prolyl isomerase